MPAPFLEPLEPGVPPAVSAWIKGLKEVEAHLEKWAFDLGEEAFWWRPKEGANPIGGLVRHIAGSSLRLLSYAFPQELPDWAKKGREWELLGEPEAKEAVVARFREAWARLLSAFGGRTWARRCRWAPKGSRPPGPTSSTTWWSMRSTMRGRLSMPASSWAEDPCP